MQHLNTCNLIFDVNIIKTILYNPTDSWEKIQGDNFSHRCFLVN